MANSKSAYVKQGDAPNQFPTQFHLKSTGSSAPCREHKRRQVPQYLPHNQIFGSPTKRICVSLRRSMVNRGQTSIDTHHRRSVVNPCRARYDNSSPILSGPDFEIAVGKAVTGTLFILREQSPLCFRVPSETTPVPIRRNPFELQSPR